jgi:hypothetical protein
MEAGKKDSRTLPRQGCFLFVRLSPRRGGGHHERVGGFLAREFDFFGSVFRP